MAAIEYYLAKGFTPINKTVIIQEASAVAIWSPSTSTRAVITNLTISNNVAGTIAFYWGNIGGSKIAEFLLAGSTTLVPAIGSWEATAYDRGLFAVTTPGHTDGFRINLTGFELS